jgi:hypothetical protein
MDRTSLLAGAIFLLGFCSGLLAMQLMPGKRISEVVFENASGVGVRTITLSYVSMGEDGDISIEISPSQEPTLHVAFYLSAEADFTVEASLTDGSVVYGQYDSLSPGAVTHMKILESRIDAQ